MTSYSAMAARGREASAERTRGRRKVTAERVEHDAPNVFGLDGKPFPYVTVAARLIGSCGHTLRWLAAVPVRDGVPRAHPYLDGMVGRKMTCQHNDCRIPEKPPREPREDDCTWTIYRTQDMDEEGRRCAVRAQWHTEEGDVCTRHRNYLRDQGYISDDGERITR